ncbi:hypothetical protein ACFLVX_04975 [Chloroflexota bacterium]
MPKLKKLRERVRKVWGRVIGKTPSRVRKLVGARKRKLPVRA